MCKKVASRQSEVLNGVRSLCGRIFYYRKKNQKGRIKE